jgi:hypothetical protein
MDETNLVDMVIDLEFENIISKVDRYLFDVSIAASLITQCTRVLFDETVDI